MPFSDYLSNQILSWIKGTATATAPTGTFITLHTADPGPAGTAANVTASITGSGNRVSVPQANLSAIGAGSPSGRQISNVALTTITNAAANGSPLTVTHVAIWDAITGGNCLMRDALASGAVVTAGDVVRFAAGTLILRSN
jgi:hypothetical protein